MEGSLDCNVESPWDFENYGYSSSNNDYQSPSQFFHYGGITSLHISKLSKLHFIQKSFEF
jgi:hypothetical protein